MPRFEVDCIKTLGEIAYQKFDIDPYSDPGNPEEIWKNMMCDLEKSDLAHLPKT